ncbi:MAG: hypothetical protein OIF50_15845 [Flavobacteriaceae bacterium]|nr:hypothetical protein [Flavobacteriaceae bacterium]
MKKRLVVLVMPLLMAMLTSFSLFRWKAVEVPESLKTANEKMVGIPVLDQMEEDQLVYVPFTGKSFVGFKEALGFKESQGNYFITNTFGYLGKYQFAVNTLKLLGVYNPEKFLNNPALQEKVFQLYIARNKWILRRDIQRFTGKHINGVQITESGILAAAHLAGAGNVKKYLRSFGANNFEDALGTSVQNYMQKFSGYDISFIRAQRSARL